MLGALQNVHNNKHRWSERDARGYANAAVAPDAQPGPPSDAVFQPAASARRGSGTWPPMRGPHAVAAAAITQSEDTGSDGVGQRGVVPYAAAQEPSRSLTPAALGKAVSVTPAATVSEDTVSDVVVRAAAPVPPASEVPKPSRGLIQSAAALGASLRGTPTPTAKYRTLGTPIPTAKDASAQRVAKFEPPVDAVGRDVIALRHSPVVLVPGVVRPTMGTMGTSTAIAQDRTLGTPIANAGSAQLVPVPGPGVGGSTMLGTPTAKGRSTPREVGLVADPEAIGQLTQLQTAVAKVLVLPYVAPDVKAAAAGVEAAVANGDWPGLHLGAENLQKTVALQTGKMLEDAETSEAKLAGVIANLEKKAKKTDKKHLEKASALQRILQKNVAALKAASEADYEPQIAQVTTALGDIDEFLADISSKKSDRKRQQSKWAWLSAFIGVAALVTAGAYAMNESPYAHLEGTVGGVPETSLRTKWFNEDVASEPLQPWNTTNVSEFRPYYGPNEPVPEGWGKPPDRYPLGLRYQPFAVPAEQQTYAQAAWNTGAAVLGAPMTAASAVGNWWRGSPPTTPTRPVAPPAAPAGNQLQQSPVPGQLPAWMYQASPLPQSRHDGGQSPVPGQHPTWMSPNVTQSPAYTGAATLPLAKPSPYVDAPQSNRSAVSTTSPLAKPNAALPTQTGVPHFYSDNLTEGL
jgi:hypothetical protein